MISLSFFFKLTFIKLIKERILQYLVLEKHKHLKIIHKIRVKKKRSIIQVFYAQKKHKIKFDN
jgi:hypothetical protein